MVTSFRQRLSIAWSMGRSIGMGLVEHTSHRGLGGANDQAAPCSMLGYLFCVHRQLPVVVSHCVKVVGIRTVET